MKYIIALIAVLSVSSICYAQPVYLECAASSENSKEAFKVKLDESTGKVTHTAENGSAFNTDGFFSANEVNYQKIDTLGDIAKITQIYKLNRNDLTVSKKEIAESFNGTPPLTVEKLGSCKLISNKKKKF